MTSLQQTNPQDLWSQNSQVKRWMFTSEQLKEIRERVNREGIERARKALRTEEELKAQAEGKKEPSTEKDVDFITWEDQLTYCRFFQTKILSFCKHFNFDDTVKATAIAYFMRFYLFNSAMDYDPKLLVMTSVFLSAKVENVLKPYDAFKDIKNWPSRDVLLELEFALSRGIQFDYMVYHPYFPLRGVMLDMQEHLKITRPRGELSALFQKLFDSAESAKEYVNAAILTDLIFTHSPAQIAWGALLAGAKKHDFDDDVERYISARLVEESPERRVEFRSRLQEIAEQSRMQIECDQKALKAQAGEIDKKLKDCRNPEFDRASLIYQRNVEAEQEVQRERKRRKVEEAQARQKDRERVFD